MGPDEPASRFPRRRKLASELRELRDLAGISGRALARRIGVSQSKVSRIENGSAVPSLPEVQAWSRELGLDDDVRHRLTAMTKAAHTEAQPWRAALAGKGHLQNDILRREAAARQIRVFQSSVVPGLLQTPDYAREVFALAGRAMTEAEHAAAVAVRLDRQLEMYEGRRSYEFLIAEAALRWSPGPSRLLAVQLERIAHLGTLDNVTIGVIPLTARATTVLSHGFVLYDADDGRTATIETLHAQVTVYGADEVGMYEEHWSRLHRMALSGTPAQHFLDRLGAEYRDLANREATDDR